MYDIFEPSLMNVKMKAQETSTLSQPKKLASRIQTSPQSQINSSVNPCHKAIPFIKERPSRVQHYQTTASTQTGLEANSQFQQQSVQQTQLQPQQLQRASGARAGSTSAATAFSGETRKMSLSARSVSAIPTASTSTEGGSQYRNFIAPAQPYQDLLLSK